MNKRLQFGLESVWGTDVAATKRKAILSGSMSGGATVIESDAMDGNLVREAAYQGPQVPTFEFDTEFNDADADLLLIDWMMGSQAFAAIGGTTSAGPPYTHAFITEEFLNSLTLEMAQDGTCQQIVGAKCDEFNLRGAWAQGMEGVCRASYKGTGKTLSPGVTITAGQTADTPTPWLFSHLTTKDVGATAAANVVLRSFDLKIKNNLPTIPNMGSLYQAEPVRAGFCEIDLTFVAQFKVVDALSEFVNFTEGSPQLVFTRGSDTLTIDMPKGRMTAFGNPIQGPALIEQTFTWRAFRAGGTPFTITIVNTVQTIA